MLRPLAAGPFPSGALRSAVGVRRSPSAGASASHRARGGPVSAGHAALRRRRVSACSVKGPLLAVGMVVGPARPAVLRSAMVCAACFSGKRFHVGLAAIRPRRASVCSGERARSSPRGVVTGPSWPGSPRSTVGRLGARTGHSAQVRPGGSAWLARWAVGVHNPPASTTARGDPVRGAPVCVGERTASAPRAWRRVTSTGASGSASVRPPASRAGRIGRGGRAFPAAAPAPAILDRAGRRVRRPRRRRRCDHERPRRHRTASFT